MKKKIFPYAPWFKGLGLILIVVGIISFILRYKKNGVFDFNELAIGLCFGLLFIFFSKEKVDDEMIHQLKFKALTKAVFVTFFLMHLYNYIFLNWRFERENDMILSISAYQFLAATLILATGIFYFEKKQVALKGEE
jgi:hypothetical protein